ncbi:PD-(D/E)XK nuclease family protein [Psychroflexus sp. ALD_RP9]|uniref:PD-(D/E)XK nuclease family protein n=1 Tax=Psychroflexus sp. ALD_RP9 TaxID=2777186 RepID=UPI001A8F0A6F|nr:PD-(D/E)XK nuclease family protein [Psychroflexus sp. ALD_RP9]QSS97860.1 PD-(D/E)XK nuclease family protein [Psychroflexus sp. ALD_RP9]
MNTFLDQVVESIITQDLRHSSLIFPSKRAANLCKKKLFAKLDSPIILPEFISIESFIANLAEVEIIDHTESIFQFYQAYLSVTQKDQAENFENFYSWAETLIHDFNEIDRYDINAEKLFKHLSDIKDIEHWSNAQNKSDLVKKYLKFWEQLPQYYTAFVDHLQHQSKAYQGLAYRLAKSNCKKYLNQTQNYFFLVGFNALNTCEIDIFKMMLDSGNATAYWDIDAYLLKNHKSAEFIRSYNTWPYYSRNPIQPTNSSFVDSKAINIYQVSKQIGQAKAVAQILSKMPSEQLEHTALVLGDESLLQPIINALPSSIEKANITMGLSLSKSILSPFFNDLIALQLKSSEHLYYKDLLKIINHNLIKQLYSTEVSKVNKYILDNNLLQVEVSELAKKLRLSDNFYKLLTLSLNTSTDVRHFLESTLSLISSLLNHNNLSRRMQFLLEEFAIVFEEIQAILTTYNFTISFKSFKSLYQSILSKKSIDFKGSADKGFQILGMLETRVLDFETIILTGINEGVLPSGKSQNSYLPFDLKQNYGLPTYTEKDNVYAYHFFRLLQRTKTAHLLFNVEAEGLQKAEQSRFVTQLEIFRQPKHTIKKYNVSADATMQENKLQEVHKTPEMISELNRLFNSGISPSALTTYIRNPIDFYKRYLLGIKDQNEIEEEVSYKTHGTIVHNTLEKLYENHIGKPITVKDIKEFLNTYESVLIQQFSEQFDVNAIKHGQNKLIFEIAKQQTKRFLQLELTAAKMQDIKLIKVESTKTKAFQLKSGQKIKLKGTVDRIDQINGKYRTLDYKTGKVEPSHLKAEKDWEGFTSDYKYSKAFQVLFYTLLVEDEISLPLTAGIISFKNLKSGFMEFQLKYNKTKGNSDISAEVLEQFKLELDQLISEILNPKVPFLEKIV